MDTLDPNTSLEAGTIAFLSWARQGLSGQLLATASASSEAGRLQLPVSMQVTSGASATSLSSTPVSGAPKVQFYGPADVAGIDVRQVIRTEPVALTAGFEPNLFPLVEFDRPDLPWMFSPASPDPQGHWQPWITLIVVPKAVAQVQAAPDATKTLSVIDCPVVELPPLDQAWAWAHAQVIQGSTGGKLLDLLDNDARSLSRLIAARRLDANTAYVACVVPTYKLGRRAGLGEKITSAELQDQALVSAWPDPAAAAAGDHVVLPVYFHWEFTTGEAGDFESLARLLTARPVPDGVGAMEIDVSAPGWGVSAAAGQVSARFATEVLRDHPIAFYRLNEAAGATSTADASGNGNHGTLSPTGVTLGVPGLGAGGTAARFDGLGNGRIVVPDSSLLSPKHITMEALVTWSGPNGFQQRILEKSFGQTGGTRPNYGLGIMDDGLPRAELMTGLPFQDYYVTGKTKITPNKPSHIAATYDGITLALYVDGVLDASLPASGDISYTAQANDLGIGNQVNRPRAFNGVIDELAIHDRALSVDRIRAHISQPLTMRGVLQPAGASTAAWAESDAFHQQLLEVLNGQRQVSGSLPNSSSPLIGPPIYGQNYPRLTSLEAKTVPQWLNEINLSVERRIAAGLGAMVVRFEQEPLMAAAWDQLAEAALANQERKRKQLAEAVNAAPAVQTRAQALAFTSAALASAPAPPRSLTMTRMARSGAAGSRARPPQAHPQVESMLDSVRTLALEPRAMQPRLRALPGAERPVEPIELQTFAPAFGTPVSDLLADFFPSYLLPGMDKIEPNSVTLLQANPEFIEAFMVGLNHEMAREMSWRGFPVDQRGTFFQTFWDRRGSGSASTAADIAPIGQWRADSRLGSHIQRDSAPAVLLIRGELLRRFPRAAVYAEQASWQGSQRTPGGQQRHPLFLMHRPPDITLVAFDLSLAEIRGDSTPAGDPGWFFVLQELPGEPRFGLNVASATFGGNPGTWRDLAWSDVAGSEAALKAMRYLPLSTARSDGTLPSAAAGPTAAWAASAADMALITRQLPFQLAIHGRVWFEILPSI